MAFQVLDVVRQRPVARRIYVLMPPVLTLGLLLSRASDLFGLDPHHPEVATVLGSSASTGDRLQLLLTGQGAIEGALLAFFVFAVLSPRLPSLRAASEPTKVAVQGKMMSHAGWWALIALMMLFDPAAYEPMTAPPETPTVALSTWDAFVWVVLFTLLLMMAGEILTATAHMASSGETNLLFHRALLKTAVAGLVGWLVLSKPPCSNRRGGRDPPRMPVGHGRIDPGLHHAHGQHACVFHRSGRPAFSRCPSSHLPRMGPRPHHRLACGPYVEHGAPRPRLRHGYGRPSDRVAMGGLGSDRCRRGDDPPDGRVRCSAPS